MVTSRRTENRKKPAIQAGGREQELSVSIPMSTADDYRGKYPSRREKVPNRGASPEDLEASKIFERADRELTALEERTQRLMHHYGL
jgi:hypothetical protein